MSRATLEDAALPETSVYVGEHHDVQLDSIQIRGRKGTSLLVAVDLVAGGALTRLEAWLEVDGIYVQPGQIAEKKHTAAHAAAELARWLDVQDLEAPVWDRFRYVFRPRPT